MVGVSLACGGADTHFYGQVWAHVRPQLPITDVFRPFCCLLTVICCLLIVAPLLPAGTEVEVALGEGDGDVVLGEGVPEHEVEVAANLGHPLRLIYPN